MNSTEKYYQNKVAILVDNFTRLKFYIDVLRVKGINFNDVTLLHTNLFTYLWVKNANFGFNSHLLRSRTIKSVDSNFECTIEEVISNQKIMRCLITSQEDLLQKVLEEVEEVWVFSGFQFAYSRIKKLIPPSKCLYFEIGNFPNKYQESGMGINADSDHDKVVKRLREDISPSANDVEALFDNISNFIPSEPPISVFFRIREVLVNKIGYLFLSTLAPSSSFSIQFSRFFNKCLCKKRVNKYLNVELPKGPYALFISQVEYDTQTVFQSTETGISAIKKAKEMSESTNLKLVVRLHPREKNYRELLKIIAYCELNDILISNKGSLLNAVKFCSHVYTINSTGGLQSLLLGKNVTTFGRAFYSDWNEQDVVIYHSKVLKNIE